MTAQSFFWISVLASLYTQVTSQCADPGSPGNGTRQLDAVTVGSVARFLCNNGFIVANSVDEVEYVMICQGEQAPSWNGSTPSCTPRPCPSLSVVANATMTGQGGFYSDVVTVTCDSGYRTSVGTVETTLLCQADGRWSVVLPVCDGVQCSDPEPVAGGRLLGDNTEFRFKDTAEYECDLGYHVTQGDSTLVCNMLGTWDGLWPVCERMDCGAPEPLDHASQLMTGSQYGDWVRYTCHSGYMRNPAKGDLQRNCTGSWTGDPPECVGVFCDDPGVRQNSSRTASSFRYPETVSYTCDPGFHPDFSSGMMDVTCQRDATWDVQPASCIRIACSDVNSSVNAVTSSDSFFFGDVKAYTCVPGYTVTSGQLRRPCLHTGAFEGSPPVCERVSCGNPGDVSNSVREGQGHHFRDMVKYTCDIGYEIVGQPNIASRSLTCQFDGNWSLPMPECHRVTCGGIILTSNVVVASEDGVHYGDSVTLECQTGYLYNSGSLMRHCREDKRWNGTSPTCTPVKCGAPPSAPDVKVAGDRFYFPFSVFYSCETGYEVVPSDSPSTSNGLTCSKDGNWEGAGLPACQKVACKPPQRIRSASLVSPAPGDGVYLFGDSVTYACDVGHRWNPASGALARNCTGTKSWSGDPPACERVSCGDPGDVEGAQRLAQGFLYTDKANYSCRLGYENPSGHTWGIISCGADGNWTGQTPNCQRVCCGDPGLGNHSTRIGQDFCFTAQVHYQCHAGFRVPDGLYILQCGGDKRWSSPTPHCEGQPDIRTYRITWF